MIKSPLVVGYKGEIGSFILQGLLKVIPKANNIWCIDINESEKEKIVRIKKSDSIFLCVPIQDTVKWLVRYKRYLKGKIIFEQASLKEWIYKDKRINKLRLIPMHILFRPSATPNKEDRKTILIAVGYLDTENFARRSALINLLRKVTDSSIEIMYNVKAHDVIMAYQQALVHKVILALGETLVLCSGTHPFVNTYLSKKIKEMNLRILKGDPKLYKFIQTNKYAKEVLREFKSYLK